MERKTKHRFVGIVVLLGIFIFLVSFFRAGDYSSETITIQAPPFPEQTMEVNNETINHNEPVQLTQDKQKVDVLEESKEHRNTNEVTKNNESNINEKKQDQVSLLSDSETNTTLAKLEIKKQRPKLKPSNFITTLKQKVDASDASEDDGLVKLATAAWVIQIGSFKNKTIALHLVNKLRANGYHAFIQQVSVDTRVFVGPETKSDVARKLANRLENELHIKGIVISYQPLTL